MVGATVLILWFPRRAAPPSSPPSPVVLASNSAPKVEAPVTPPAPPPAVADEALQNACKALRSKSDIAAIRADLEALRQSLAAMPKREAIAAIRQFLDSKEDASTRLGFKLSSDGSLENAPTLRTFLLDELSRIDPAAAADYSRVILSSMDSADEWAVALRGLALGDDSADGRTLLAEKAGQMLEYSPWQQDPSVGYLESFDVAVYLGGTDLMGTLSDMVRSEDNSAISHAAFLALDRLVISDPTDVLQALEDDPDLMAGRESTRADFFARANVTDPAQKSILESYLLDPSIGAAELQTFAGIFPNANFMLSANLLTQSTTPGGAAQANLDAQSLAVAQQWLADPRFAQVAPELQTIVQRLQGFVTQAQRGR